MDKKAIKKDFEQGYNVYLTDVRKYYPSPSHKAVKEQALANADLLVRELQCLNGAFFLILSGMVGEVPDSFSLK